MTGPAILAFFAAEIVKALANNPDGPVARVCRAIQAFAVLFCAVDFIPFALGALGHHCAQAWADGWRLCQWH